MAALVLELQGQRALTGDVAEYADGPDQPAFLYQRVDGVFGVEAAPVAAPDQDVLHLLCLAGGQHLADGVMGLRFALLVAAMDQLKQVAAQKLLTAVAQQFLRGAVDEGAVTVLVDGVDALAGRVQQQLKPAVFALELVAAQGSFGDIGDEKIEELPSLVVAKMAAEQQLQGVAMPVALAQPCLGLTLFHHLAQKGAYIRLALAAAQVEQAVFQQNALLLVEDLAIGGVDLLDVALEIGDDKAFRQAVVYQSQKIVLIVAGGMGAVLDHTDRTQQTARTAILRRHDTAARAHQHHGVVGPNDAEELLAGITAPVGAQHGIAQVAAILRVDAADESVKVEGGSLLRRQPHQCRHLLGQHQPVVGKTPFPGRTSLQAGHGQRVLFGHGAGSTSIGACSTIPLMIGVCPTLCISLTAKGAKGYKIGLSSPTDTAAHSQ